METYNPILKYLFPIFAFLQYLGCDSYRDVTRGYSATEATVDVLGEDCSDSDKYVYNGFYEPLKEGRLFVKKRNYSLDSLYVSEKPIISLTEIKTVTKSFDVTGNSSIQVTFTEKGKQLFKEYTSNHIGDKIAIIVKDELITAPVIATQISEGKVEISGDFTQAEADRLYRYLYRMIQCTKLN